MRRWLEALLHMHRLQVPGFGWGSGICPFISTLDPSRSLWKGAGRGVSAVVSRVYILSRAVKLGAGCMSSPALLAHPSERGENKVPTACSGGSSHNVTSGCLAFSAWRGRAAVGLVLLAVMAGGSCSLSPTLSSPPRPRASLPPLSHSWDL